MFIQDPESAPSLLSAMTDDQWLDAISCPRIDPIRQGQRVMTRNDVDNEVSDFGSSDSET